ncbi:MAG: replicative DNA helicase, partial [Bacillus sp. (in: firmicutes)]
MMGDSSMMYSAEAEAAVIGALLMDDERMAECRLDAEHFYTKKLGKLMTAMRNVAEQGKPIDPLAVMEELGADELNRIGGLTYLLELAESVPTTANFGYYEEIVLEYYRKRRVIEVSLALIRDVKQKDYDKALQSAMNAFMDLEQMEKEDEGDIRESLLEIYEECETEQDEVTGIATGFEELDLLTGGFQSGDLVVVGARPSVGKTALALHFAARAAMEHTCLYVSLEMPEKQLLKRMLSSLGNIHSRRMRSPNKLFQESDWHSLSAAMGRLYSSSLRILDEPGMDLPYIWRYARKLRQEIGPDRKLLIIIDYLQLIGSNRSGKDNRYSEVSEISRGLKNMARKLNATVLAISQLNRAVESRQNKRPMLSDLRESGQ